MVVHALIPPSSWETKAKRSLCVQDQPSLNSLFQLLYSDTLSQQKAFLFLSNSCLCGILKVQTGSLERLLRA